MERDAQHKQNNQKQQPKRNIVEEKKMLADRERPQTAPYLSTMQKQW